VSRVLAALGRSRFVQRDVPGFIWNRLQAALLRESLWLVGEGVATPETVDRVVRSGLARRYRYTGRSRRSLWRGRCMDAGRGKPVSQLSNATRTEGLERWLLRTRALDAVRLPGPWARRELAEREP
jgi:hypothetical protein